MSELSIDALAAMTGPALVTVSREMSWVVTINGFKTRITVQGIALEENADDPLVCLRVEKIKSQPK